MTSAPLWAEQFVKEIWRFHWEIWNQRNESLHGTGNHVVLGTKDSEKEIAEELKVAPSFSHRKNISFGEYI